MKLKDWFNKRQIESQPVTKTVNYKPLLESLEKSFGIEIYPVLAKYISKNLDPKNAKTIVYDILDKSFNDMSKSEWIQSQPSNFHRTLAEKTLQSNRDLLIKGLTNISDRDIEDLTLWDGYDFLDKSDHYVESPPKKLNETHPYKPYIAKVHSDNKLSWYHNQHQSLSNDNFIKRNLEPWLQSKFSKEHHPMIRNFFNKIMESSTRHAVPARDTTPGPNVIRARHLKAILQNDDSLNFQVGQGKLHISAQRHGHGLPTHEWEFSPQEGIKDVQFERQSKGWVRKSEELEKGAARRLYGNFDPQKELPDSNEMANWVEGNIEGREKIPDPSPNARLRMLNKLRNRAKVRFNPETKQNEYLLHRQLSQWEKDSAVKGDKINHQKTKHQSGHTSWTPFLNSITESIGIYDRSSFDREDTGSYNHIVSAWIPESHIKTIPLQYGESGTENVRSKGPPSGTALKEQEVIVNPNHNSEIHEIHKDSGADPKKWNWQKIYSKTNPMNKSEDLEKAVDESSWKRVSGKHFEDGSITVNHKAHLEQPHAHDAYNKMLADPKVFKGKKDEMSGISAKMIHTPHGYTENNEFTSYAEPDTYMTKPYHRKPESHTRSWVDKPILGWATMATRNIYHAGDIGHLIEDVSTQEHQGVPVTAHKFEKDHATLALDRSLMTKNVNPDERQKIATMDYLMGNNDRHAGNMLVSNSSNTEGYHGLKAIDHERNFQYKQPLHKVSAVSGFRDHQNDTPYNFMTRPSLSLLNRISNWHSHEETVDWWNKNKHKIKNQMEKELSHINDEDIRNHIRDNFNHRWEKLSNWADNLNSRQDFWNKDDFHGPFKDTRIIKRYTPKITSKFLKDTFKGDPKEAISRISDIINRKGKLTPNQTSVVKSGMEKVIDSLTPDQAVDLFSHAMENPKLKTQAMKNHNLQFDKLLLNRIAENNSPEHMTKLADHIDSLPEEKKGSLPEWSDYLRQKLAQ